MEIQIITRATFGLHKHAGYSNKRLFRKIDDIQDIKTNFTIQTTHKTYKSKF